MTFLRRRNLFGINVPKFVFDVNIEDYTTNNISFALNGIFTTGEIKYKFSDETTVYDYIANASYQGKTVGSNGLRTVTIFGALQKVNGIKIGNTLGAAYTTLGATTPVNGNVDLRVFENLNEYYHESAPFQSTFPFSIICTDMVQLHTVAINGLSGQIHRYRNLYFSGCIALKRTSINFAIEQFRSWGVIQENIDLTNCNAIVTPDDNKVIRMYHIADAGINGVVVGLDTLNYTNTIYEFSSLTKGLGMTSSSVNSVLAQFLSGNKNPNTLIIAGNNAAPTGQGITDKATLISRGWTVTTN